MMRSSATRVALVIAIVGALMATSPASGQALFEGEDMGYYDATGRRVGTLSGWFEVVFHTGSGHTLFVIVMPSHLSGNSTLHFAQRNCAGPAFLRRQNGREPSSWVGGPRQTAFVQDGPFTRQGMRSTRTTDGVCVNSSAGGDYAPAVPSGIDLADYFTGPFTFRARPGDPVQPGPQADPRDRTNTIGLYDAAGKRVGTTVPGPLSPSVPLVTDEGVTVLLDYVGPAKQEGYYATIDCTGPRFRRDGSEPPSPFNFSPHMLVGPRTSLYIPVGTVEQRTMFSLMEADGDCVILDQSDPGRYFDYWTPYRPTGADLADYYTPPVELRAGTGVRSLRTPD